MAVTYGAVGTGASGTTSCTPSYPTGISSATSKLLCVITGRSNTAGTAPTMPAGWTSVLDFEGGTGTWGADTGTRRVTVFQKDTVTGSESGTVTVSLSGTTANTLRATIHRVEVPSGYGIDVAASTGADTSNGTGFSATGSTSISFAAGDLLLIAVAQNIDSGTQSAQSITASGITFGTLTNRASTAVTNGNDHRHIVDSVPVSSGSGTVAPTYAYTISASGSGPVGFLRLRDVLVDTPPTITADPSDATDILDATGRTFSVTATGTPAPTYQWEENTGSGWVNVTGGSGGTTATYTAPTATAALSGIQYRCVATNSEGSDTSAAATWTIIPYRQLTEGSSTTNATSYNGASITVGQNRLGTVNVTSQGVDLADRQAPTSVQIGSTSLTKVDEQIISDYTVVSTWRCLSTSSAISGTLSFGFSQTQDTVSWGAGEWEGVDNSGTNGSGAIGTAAKNSGTGTSLSVGSISDPGSAGKWVYAGWGHSDAAAPAAATHAAGAGLVEVSETNAVDFNWYGAQAIAVGVKASSVAGTLSTSETWGGIAFVVIEATGGGGAVDLAGAAQAFASAAAALQLLKGLAAAAAAQATASANLTHGVPLSGSAQAVATASAALTTAINMAGSAAAQASASGQLSISVPLAGAMAALSTAGGALSLNIALAAASAAQAQASGTLSTQGVVDLQGAALGQAQAAAALSLSVSLLGAALGVGTAQGALSKAVQLQGAAAGLATSAAALSLGIPLSGAAQGVASATGALTASSGLTGAAVAVATAGGALSLSVALQGSALAQANASGSLSLAVGLSGTAAGRANVAGTLFLTIPLSGAAAGVASAAGGLVVTVQLGGAAAAQASAGGSLTVPVQLVGAAGSQALATGDLFVAGLGAATATAYKARRAKRIWRALRPTARSWRAPSPARIWVARGTPT